MNRILREYRVFAAQPRSMRILLITNIVYALVLPVLEIFVAAYVMRNSHDVSKVVTYQLAIYAATPLAFLCNGYLLGASASNGCMRRHAAECGGADGDDFLERDHAFGDRGLRRADGDGFRVVLGEPRVPGALYHDR